jgi:hypothetical protein
MPQRQRFSFSGFSAYRLSKPHPGATAVLVDQPQFGFVLPKLPPLLLPQAFPVFMDENV